MWKTAHLSREAINSYLDGELNAEDRSRVEAHLATCEQCREEAASLNRLFETLEGLEDVSSPDIVTTVLSRIASTRQRQWRTWLVSAMQVAVTTALLTLSWSSLDARWQGLTGWMFSLQVPEAWITAITIVSEPWQIIEDWIAVIIALLGEWLGRISSLPELALPELSLPELALPITQLAVLLTLAAATWLLANFLLLRRECRNGISISNRTHGGV